MEKQEGFIPDLVKKVVFVILIDAFLLLIIAVYYLFKDEFFWHAYGESVVTVGGSICLSGFLLVVYNWNKPGSLEHRQMKDFDRRFKQNTAKRFLAEELGLRKLWHLVLLVGITTLAVGFLIQLLE